MGVLHGDDADECAREFVGEEEADHLPSPAPPRRRAATPPSRRDREKREKRKAPERFQATQDPRKRPLWYRKQLQAAASAAAATTTSNQPVAPASYLCATAERTEACELSCDGPSAKESVAAAAARAEVNRLQQKAKAATAEAVSARAATVEAEAEVARLRAELKEAHATPPTPPASAPGTATLEAAQAEVVRLTREVEERRGRSRANLEKMYAAQKEKEEMRLGREEEHAVHAAQMKEEQQRRHETEQRLTIAERQLACMCGSADALAVISSLEELDQLESLCAAGLTGILTRRAELAQSEEERRARELSCAVCLDAPRGVAYGPCGHVACCAECAPKVDTCPLCKQGVRTRMCIFLP
jgi:hypothetical protein